MFFIVLYCPDCLEKCNVHVCAVSDMAYRYTTMVMPKLVIILFYYIYTSLFFFLSLRFQINIFLKFQHLECFDLYVLITLWASIVLCFNYIETFNRAFNSNKGFRFNLERLLLLLGGYVTLYFIYIVLWSQYSSVFDNTMLNHL